MRVPVPSTVRLSCVIALILITNNRSFAQNYTWSATSGGSWVNGTNWGEAPGDFPSGSSDRATFSSAGNGSAKIVTLDVAITLRRLNFSADQTGSITLAPGIGGSLTLTTASIIRSGQPSLEVLAGSGNHTITADVTLSGPDTHRWVIGSNQTLTVAGNIDGSQGLTLSGPGTLMLTGTNTYTGPTVMTQGTLGGSGALASAVTTQLGTTINPGTSASSPDLTLQNGLNLGGRYLVTLFDNNSLSRLDVTSGTASLLPATSSLEIVLGAGVTVDSFRAGGTRSFTIIDAGNNQLSGTFSTSDFTSAGFAASEWTVTYDNVSGDVTVNFTPVPESALMLGLAAGVLFAGWRVGKRCDCSLSGSRAS